MADNEDPKDKSAPEAAPKPAVAADVSAAPDVKPKAPVIAPSKPVEAKSVESKSADTKAEAAPAPKAVAPQPVAKPAPVAAAPAKVEAKVDAPAAKVDAPAKVAAPAAKPVAKAPVVAAPVAKVAAKVKAKPGPKPKIKTPPVAQAKPVETVVPAKVAPTKPVIEVAKDVKSAIAPLTVPKAAIPKAAPKTAPTKPVFAGLLTNFILEETNMSTNFAGIQDAITQTQAKAKAAFEKGTSVLGEVTEFTKGNVEAVVESSKILAEGVQGLGSEFVAEGRTAFETMTGDIKELAATKSPTDFFKLQGDLVRKNFDTAVAYSSKNSEALLKLFGDSFAPISGRMSIALEKARSVSL
ncbi:phasin family protein [Novosphingobium sp. BL-52-GroH]|uniref:phasin family protein n=1 Tax=Novosphingobium sp. BL-52-GroH TaxID=3349877 RepID=UPI00384DBD7B